VAATTPVLEMSGCVFDAGTKGFAGGYAMDVHSCGSNHRLWNISLLRGADIYLPTSMYGWYNIQTSTGGGSVRH
jgi:hypothetical protein